MAEVSELNSVKVVDKDKLPEELTVFDGFSKNESGHWVGVTETGSSKQVQNLGDLLMKTLVTLGVAEEEVIVTESPEMIALRREHEREIQELKNQHAQEMETLRHEFDKKLDDQGQRISQLTAQLEERGIISPETEPRPEIPEPELDEQEVDGYKKGEAVALRRHNGKYDTGYEVRGFAKDNDRDIVIVRSKATGASYPIYPTELKKESEVEPDEIFDEPTTVRPPSAARNKVSVRESLPSQIRRRFSHEPAPPQYYVDGQGRYYYLEGDEPIYVPDSVVEEDNRAAAAFAIGAAVVGGLIGYALANKSGGHNYSSEFNEIINQNSGLKTQVHDLSIQHTHELNAIHGLHNEIARDHNQEMGGINSIRQRLNESNTVTGFKFAFRYPWDWAANRVGAYRAESWLHTLAGRAAQHGHKIRWIFNGYEPNGSVREILQVDGTTNTQKVIQVVSQYR